MKKGKLKLSSRLALLAIVLLAAVNGYAAGDLTVNGTITAGTGGVKFADGVQLSAGTGSVVAFAGQTPPAGWLECNGLAISRTTYASLFAVIGTMYGAGNGSTTFNLPQLQGEFIRGWDHGRGVDPTASRPIGSYEADAFQNITGSFIADDVVSPSGAFSTSSMYVNGYAQGTGYSQVVGLDASRVARTSTETRPRNIAMMYVIKY